MGHYSPAQQPTSSLDVAINSAMIAQQAAAVAAMEQHDLEQMFALSSTSSAQQPPPPPQPASRYLNQRDKILMYQLNQYYLAKATARSKNIAKTIQEVVKIVHNVLRELEIQEPRFISTFNEVNGHYEGLNVVSSSEFEVVLYLNQMGVFNFVDDGSLPGCAVLKLSDGRKRSMSLWVEFITASGYLSARKIRSRFQTLMVQACERSSYSGIIKLIADTSEVKIRVRDSYTIQITPAFRCNGLWPRSASHWPQTNCPWPPQQIVHEVKSDGFDLLSKECITAQRGKQSAMEGDAWLLSFNDAENKLLHGSNRKKCLSILKTLRDRNLDGLGQSCISTYHLKTLLLFECEKHPNEYEWDDYNLGDRINGILLQLISCLQSRRCPHYFLPNLDLFRGKPIENVSKQIWRLVRQLIMDPASLERL